MNQIRLLYIIIIITTIVHFSSLAQEGMQNETVLTEAIYEGFKQFKDERNIAFDPDIEEDLIDAYKNKIINMSLKDFFDQEKANTAIQYYSTPIGVEKLLSEWVSSTEVRHWDKIFSIDQKLYLEVYFASKDTSDPYFGENMLNKYATLLLEISPQNLVAEIYLNDRYVCDSKAAANGICVASDKEYKLEVKADTHTTYKGRIKLKRQERKKVNCNLKPISNSGAKQNKTEDHPMPKPQDVDDMVSDYAKILSGISFPEVPEREHKVSDHFVSSYAMQSPEEDFAETFKEYFESSINLWIIAINHWRETKCIAMLHKVCLMESIFSENNIITLYALNPETDDKIIIKLPKGADRELFRKTAIMVSQGLSREEIEKAIVN